MRTRAAKIEPIPDFPRSNKHQTAKEKNSSSRRRRKDPGVGMGALPDRLGSSGTVKLPQTTASTKGMTKASTGPIHPPKVLQDQTATIPRTINSSRKRNSRFTG